MGAGTETVAAYGTMPPVADDDGGGRYLTAAQTTRLAEAMKLRRAELGATVLHLWPLSRNTLSLWSQPEPRAQLGTLDVVDRVMWWEPDSAKNYARETGPLRPLPKPTPLQWAIFDARCGQRLDYKDVAAFGQAGTPTLTADQVEDLERRPLYQPLDEGTVVALALALKLDVDKLRGYAAVSVQPVGDAAVDRAAKALLDRVHGLPHEDQHSALTAASMVVESDDTRHLVELLNRLPEHAQQATVTAVRELLVDDGLRRLVGRLVTVPDSDRLELFDALATIARGWGRETGRAEPEIDYVGEAAAIAGVGDRTITEQFRDDDAPEPLEIPEEEDERG